jgi:leucyl aminopeptidase
MVDFTLRVTASGFGRGLRGDVLLVPRAVPDGKPSLKGLRFTDPTLDARLGELAARYHGSKEVGAVDAHLLPPRHAFGRVAVVSLGKSRRASNDAVRKAAAAAAQWCAQQRLSRAVLSVDALVRHARDGAVSAWVEGMVLAGFRFTRLKSNGENRGPAGRRLNKLTLASNLGTPRWVREPMEDALRIAESVNLTRHLAHEPPNIIHPVSLAQRVQALARRYGLKCRVLDDSRMRALKMGALLAVGAGSASKPRLIVLEYRGKRVSSKPIVLVGKAVTLDTGGYSIKPAASIPEMKYDKCGGIAVIGTLVAAARLRLPQRIVGIIPAAENMISSLAYRPGDIVTSMSGKTIEIGNTDAEGRLILADAFTFAQREYTPTVMIDLATLTGACQVALGNHLAGLFTDDDDLAESLLEAGERTGERCWRLPLWSDYRKQLETNDADLKNIGGSGGGAITAALFLKEFVDEKLPWAHLDIAGVASVERDEPHCPRGATGFGVRLLIDYIRNRR